MLYNNVIKRLYNFIIILLVCASLTGCRTGEAQTDIDKVDNNSVDVNQDDSVLPDKNVSTNRDEEFLKNRVIVWLGDSLTQGSLGRENDNLENAPARKLEELSGHEVDDYGFYGYNTHDIFWVYRDETQKNQTVDSEKVYVFWVGSNDWVRDDIPNCDITSVVEEIDRIIAAGNLTDYIVMGTTARVELRTDSGDELQMYQSVNKQLSEYYGEHYMDVCEFIGADGYGPDDIHLTQESYDSVAQGLYSKLISMKYIQ